MNIKAQAQINLDTEVRFLKGVGPSRAQKLAQLGVQTVGDLLEYYPRDHEFRPPLTLIKELVRDHQVTVAGQILSLRYSGRSRPPRFQLKLEDPTGCCELIWFHGGYLRDSLRPGDLLAAWGKVSQYKEAYQLVNPRWQKIQDIEELDQGDQTGMAIYPASGELSSSDIGRIIQGALAQMLEMVPERYDEEFCAQRKLPSRRQGLEWIHRPPDKEKIGQARRRLAYDELFLMELGIGLRRVKMQTLQQAFALQINERLDERIRQRFPFDLTEDQNKVINEICTDMARSVPMNRLLQGDVGSGKTVVALYAALLAVGHHQQVAIMAPTEILAEQHFQSIEQYLHHSRVKRVLIKGGLTGKKRTEITKQISQGQVDIVVGTQALLQHDVGFKNLALVVIDEQHKFGVRQRMTIRGKDVAPHYLVMTATPIPRTLAMTVFGDLDVSTIENSPPGRREIITRQYSPEHMTPAYEFIRSRVQAGEQAYFVYPRVEEQEETIPESEEQSLGENNQSWIPGNGHPRVDPIKAATAEYENLQRNIFPRFRVGLLHGQMKRDEKQRIMEEFRSGKIKILVATVVIEVGVDVPNATVMVIEHAERFGLAQLHQMRGRIGRGKKQSYCLLFAQAGTETSRQRLEIMTQTDNGFRIAEEDLRIRGPGEFFGTAQHGLPELKIADLLRDTDLLRMAQRDAFALAGDDPDLIQPRHQVLLKELQKQFGDNLGLIEVG